MKPEFIAQLKETKEPGSLYYAWQANIAMAMHDELEGKITKEEANRGAMRFLDILLRD